MTQEHETAATPAAPQPETPSSAKPAASSAAASRRVARLIGNQAMSRFVAGNGPANPRPRQAESLMIQRAPVDTAAASATPAPTRMPLIVADATTELMPGQMRKSDFLARARDEVCQAAEAALAGTIWSPIGCPYIEHWFAYYGEKDSAHIERALHKLAPEAAQATTAQDYIVIMTRRLRQGMSLWIETGDLTGMAGRLPDEMPEIDMASLLPRAAAGTGIGGRMRQFLSGVYFKLRGGAPTLTPDPQTVQSQLGAGAPLTGPVRSQMESAFGRPFSQVRVHTDAQAGQMAKGLRARAFTVGQNIAFAPGEYQPGSLVGDALMAHELAHVAQQEHSQTADSAASTADYQSLEGDADTSAGGVMARLWGGARAGLGEMAGQVLPRLQSGLRLQGCSDGPSSGGGAAREYKVDSPSEVDPSFGEEEAGVVDRVSYSGRAAGYEFHFDGDGDQRRELIGRLRAVEKTKSYNVTLLEVELEQISSEEVRKSQFTISERVNEGGGDFTPRIMVPTDGDDPTEVQITEFGGPSTVAKIYPPQRSDTDVSYRVEVNNQSATYTFPKEGEPPFQVFDATPPISTGPIWSTDVGIGAYRDKFRLTFTKENPDRDDVIMGISVLGEEGPVSGRRINLQVDGELNVHLLNEDPVHLSLDLDGDGSSDLEMYDRLWAKSDSSSSFQQPQPDLFRDHVITFRGTSVLATQSMFWEVHEGKMTGGSSVTQAKHFPAASQAQAVDALTGVKGTGDYFGHLAVIEKRRMDLRQIAADSGLIGAETFAAWQALSLALAQLQLEAGQGEVSAKTQLEAKQTARQFYEAFAQETHGHMKENDYGQGYSETINPYTGSDYVELAPFEGAGVNRTNTKYLDEIIKHLNDGDYGAALTVYNFWANGLDKWIGDQRGADKEGKELEALAALGQGLRRIGKHNPTRVWAVLHAQSEFESGGKISDVPLSLYYWKEDGKWHLIDLTKPDEPFEPTVTASDGQTEPPASLFRKLNDEDRWPENSVIYYELPSGTSGKVTVNEGLTWEEFFTWLGVGAAIVGVSLMTMGAGTVPVTTAFAVAGVSSGIAAGLDLYHHHQQGSLTADRVVLDLAQIAAGFGGATAAVSGRLVVGARLAQAEGTALSGWYTKAAQIAEPMLVPAQIAAIGGDVVSFAIVGGKTIKQLEAINNGPGTASDRMQARLILLTNLAVTGGLVGLSIKGGLAEASPQTRVYVDEIDDVLMALPAGKARPCFVAGTLIQTAAGLRPIETLQVGDAVWAGDPQQNQQALYTITATMARVVTAVLDIEMGETTITCTAEHPFWVPQQGWQQAGSLQPGDELWTKAGTLAPIRAIQPREGEFTVYNLTVDGFHTYYVSELAVLVHNKAYPYTPDPFNLAEVRAEALDSLIPLQARSGYLQRQIADLPATNPRRADLLADQTTFQNDLDALDDFVHDPGTTVDDVRQVMEIQDTAAARALVGVPAGQQAVSVVENRLVHLQFRLRLEQAEEQVTTALADVRALPDDHQNRLWLELQAEEMQEAVNAVRPDLEAASPLVALDDTIRSRILRLQDLLTNIRGELTAPSSIGDLMGTVRTRAHNLRQQIDALPNKDPNKATLQAQIQRIQGDADTLRGEIESDSAVFSEDYVNKTHRLQVQELSQELDALELTTPVAAEPAAEFTGLAQPGSLLTTEGAILRIPGTTDQVGGEAHVLTFHGPDTDLNYLRNMVLSTSNAHTVAGKFTDRAVMETVIGEAVRENRDVITTWLAGNPDPATPFPLPRYNPNRGNLGTGFELRITGTTREAIPVETGWNEVVVILRPVGSNEVVVGGEVMPDVRFLIYTAYPVR